MLESDIRELLRSSEVRSINFRLEGAIVSGPGFHELANCFTDRPNGRRIRISVNPAHLWPRSLAAYDSRHDRLHVRGGDVLDTPGGRALVVHECTHAQSDMRARTLAVRPDEAMARIAMAWYLLACGENPTAHVPRLQPDFVELARALRSRAQHAIGAPVAMTREEIILARRRVPSSYPNVTDALNNGIQGFRYHGP
jgi:hypothetical protein